MKKILFFIPTLGGGGAEKVLINLVNNLDAQKYDITVQTLFDYGINKQYLNSNIKYKYIFKKIFRGNIYILKIFSPKFLYKKMIREKYDIIVSYLEGPTTRIVSGCTDNNTKLINWIHTELNDINEFKSSYRSFTEMKKCYSKYQYTIFVSEEAKTAFNNIIKVRSKIIKNIIDVNDIIEKSKNSAWTEMDKDNNIKITTLGRLIEVKGYERLLKIHKKLIEEGIIHSLYILGDGEQREKLDKYIKNNNLDKTAILLGFKQNPYEYISKADIYICSSYKEGYNTSLIEALILEKIIITTDCSGMKEILENGKYGKIVENSEEDLYAGLKEILCNKKIRDKYKIAIKEGKNKYNIQNQIYEIEKTLF